MAVCEMRSMPRGTKGRPAKVRPEDIPKTLPERIRFEREMIAMTQAELAEAIRRPENSISDMERGVARLTVETARDIAEALGISLPRLLGEHRAPKRPPVPADAAA